MGTWSKTVFSRCGINPKRLQCFRKVSNFTVQCLSTSHRPPKQVLYFENTDRHDIPFSYPYQTVSQVTDFRVRTVNGGFQRRPELIRRRKPFSEQPDGQRLVHNLSYGLYDKCERIQQELTQTTLQLMGDRAIGVGQLVLDIGCGYGFCLSVLCREGVSVMGIDMDLQALSDLQNKTESKYLPADAVHVIRSDVSRGLCFRENVFDWAVSISFLQWLCAGRNPVKLLRTFFQSLSVVLKPVSGAGIQFYPQNVGDVKRVVHEAQNYFKGALVSDYPHLDRGRKLFLILVNNK